MREYETIYILKPDLPTEQLSIIKEKIDNVLKKGQGHILTHADWGKRKLAYSIQKFRQAQYFYLQFLAPGPEVSELERILKFDDSVLKFLTVKLKDKVQAEERVAKGVEEPLPPEESNFNVRSEQSRGGDQYGRSERYGSSERPRRTGPSSRSEPPSPSPREASEEKVEKKQETEPPSEPKKTPEETEAE